MAACFLIECPECGFEFQSAFAGVASVIGCSESCGRCGASIATPTFIGQQNMAALHRTADEPMLRDFGADGYVFMGRGIRSWSITVPELKEVNAAYERNLYRALDLIDAHYLVEVSKRQSLIDSVCIMAATAYENLTDDVFDVLSAKGALAPSKPAEIRTVVLRRSFLLDQLRLADEPTAVGHITALKYLDAFRHCLVHSAGIADTKLLERAQLLGETRMVSVGEPLNLPMTVATSLLDSLQQLSVKVLESAQSHLAL